MTIRAAGVCHSDLSMVNGTLAARFPLVLGHEATGVVAEVGPGASLAVGTPWCSTGRRPVAPAGGVGAANRGSAPTPRRRPCRAARPRTAYRCT
ncbi:alcohol dehydrogenase catalytic domain-containing protein [Micromonospora sp. M12]